MKKPVDCVKTHKNNSKDKRKKNIYIIWIGMAWTPLHACWDNGEIYHVDWISFCAYLILYFFFPFFSFKCLCVCIFFHMWCPMWRSDKNKKRKRKKFEFRFLHFFSCSIWSMIQNSNISNVSSIDQVLTIKIVYAFKSFLFHLTMDSWNWIALK